MNNKGIFQRLISLRNLPVLAAAMLIVLSIAVPTVNVSQNLYSLQITFDISQSMNVEDAGGDNAILSRLEQAKAVSAKLVQSLPCGSRIGWSVFSGNRAIPLITPVDVCDNYAGLLASLTTIDGNMRWKNASGVGKGLHHSIRAADSIGEDTAVVFFTDGHEAPPLEPGARGMPKSDDYSVTGVIAGVGNTTPVPIPKIDRDGVRNGFWTRDEVIQIPGSTGTGSQEELSYLHEKHLNNLARLSTLAYVVADSPKSLLQALEQTAASTTRSAPRNVAWIPALLALLALCWRFRFMPRLKSV